MGIRRILKWAETEEIERFAQDSIRMMWNEKFDRNTLRDYLYFRLLYQVRAYELALSEPEYTGPVGTVMDLIARDGRGQSKLLVLNGAAGKPDLLVRLQSGLGQQRQRNGQPFRNAVVRMPNPSWTANFKISKTVALIDSGIFRPVFYSLEGHIK